MDGKISLFVVCFIKTKTTEFINYIWISKQNYFIKGNEIDPSMKLICSLQLKFGSKIKICLRMISSNFYTFSSEKKVCIISYGQNYNTSNERPQASHMFGEYSLQVILNGFSYVLPYAALAGFLGLTIPLEGSGRFNNPTPSSN